MDGNLQSVQIPRQTQKLITEVSSLEKEVMHLEQHVLTLCREVLNQRLTDQGQGLHFEPSSPYSHAEKRQALAQRGEIRFKSEKMQMDSQPRNAFPQSCQRNMSVAASQGFKRPHSSISNEHHKTRHNSLPGGTFYSIDEEPREMQDSSAEPPIVSSRRSGSLA